MDKKKKQYDKKIEKEIENQSKIILDKSMIFLATNNELNLNNDIEIINSNQSENDDLSNFDSNIYNYRTELNQMNNMELKFKIKRFIVLMIFFSLIFYSTHFLEKKHYEDYNHKNTISSSEGCIVEIFPEKIYKYSWRILISNKFWRNIFLTVLFYTYDFLFLFSSYQWIKNLKNQNWEFFLSVVLLALIKYFSVEFYIMKNNEDIILNLPNLPFFLNNPSENIYDNNFFCSSSTLSIIIIKYLKGLDFKKLALLAKLNFLFMITFLFFLRIQSIFGILFGILLGLYLNKISEKLSELFDLIYNFNDDSQKKSDFFRNISIDRKVREKIDKILRDSEKNNSNIDFGQVPIIDDV